jgi:hypothetical protein
VTERSSSLLDLVLVNNPHSILYSEVGPPLLDQTRYHMPTIGVLNHSIKSHSSYKWKVFMFDRGDFESFRQQLSLVDWDSLLVSVALLWSLFFRCITCLILLVNHGGLSFLTVIKSCI